MEVASGGALCEENCRCCMAPGVAVKDLSTEYDWMGDKEVYADMLLESFDIRLSRAERAGWMICDTCITRLRDSTNFKKQVLYAESRLMRQMKGTDSPAQAATSGAALKVEPKRMKAESESDDDNRAEQFETLFCDDDTDLEQEFKNVNVKLEPLASTSNEMSNDEDMPLSTLSAGTKRKAPKEAKGSDAVVTKWPKLTIKQLKPPIKSTSKQPLKVLKVSAKATTKVLPKAPLKPPQAKPPVKAQKMSLAMKQSVLSKLAARPVKITIKAPTTAAKKGAKADNQPYKGLSILEMLERNAKPTKRHRDEMSKANSAIIIENSTVCPFRWSVRAGYCCFYCEIPHHEAEALRAHTKTEHGNDKVRNLIRQLAIEEMIKVDVTTINCKMCPESVMDIDKLKQHLKTAHAKKFFDEVNDGILPFKLTTGSFDCLMCSTTFRAFHMLNQHMNKHFENYVCETCGIGFVTQSRLTVHQNVHKVGEFKCTLCDKIFESFSARTNHISNAHSNKDRFKCPQCPERFIYYHQRQRHQIKMHDAKHLQYTCKACGKLFMRKWHLTQHLRKESCV